MQLVSYGKLHLSPNSGETIKPNPPQSSTCVPNTARIHIFAPIHNPDICPLWSERWELRACPLGCHVSTITLLTCIVSVCSTFVVIGLVAAGVKIARAIQVRWKSRSDGWWKVWKYYKRDWWRGLRLTLVDIRDRESQERRPLLEQA